MLVCRYRQVRAVIQADDGQSGGEIIRIPDVLGEHMHHLVSVMSGESDTLSVTHASDHQVEKVIAPQIVLAMRDSRRNGRGKSR